RIKGEFGKDRPNRAIRPGKCFIDGPRDGTYILKLMRSILAGLLILLLASTSFAQVRGEVESIGFGDGLYRPECWTPMVVRLDSQLDDAAEYRIEVHQRDMDFDNVIYVKDGITLNAHATQRWQICFRPDPTRGGLPEQSLDELR